MQAEADQDLCHALKGGLEAATTLPDTETGLSWLAVRMSSWALLEACKPDSSLCSRLIASGIMKLFPPTLDLQQRAVECLVLFDHLSQGQLVFQTHQSHH